MFEPAGISPWLPDLYCKRRAKALPDNPTAPGDRP